jgi:hypothetical protein
VLPPTATQFEAEEHDTALRSGVPEGTDTVDQLTPLLVVSIAPPVDELVAPTATQVVGVGQSTPFSTASPLGMVTATQVVSTLAAALVAGLSATDPTTGPTSEATSRTLHMADGIRLARGLVAPPASAGMVISGELRAT